MHVVPDTLLQCGESFVTPINSSTHCSSKTAVSNIMYIASIHFSCVSCVHDRCTYIVWNSLSVNSWSADSFAIVLTLSPPIPLKLHTTIFKFWHPGALALSLERQSTRMSKIKNSRLDQYDAEPFEQQQFGTVGVEGVKRRLKSELCIYLRHLGRFSALASLRFVFYATDHPI